MFIGDLILGQLSAQVSGIRSAARLVGQSGDRADFEIWCCVKNIQSTEGHVAVQVEAMRRRHEPQPHKASYCSDGSFRTRSHGSKIAFWNELWDFRLDYNQWPTLARINLLFNILHAPQHRYRSRDNLLKSVHTTSLYLEFKRMLVPIAVWKSNKQGHFRLIRKYIGPSITCSPPFLVSHLTKYLIRC
jgi:hypothetical protein